MKHFIFSILAVVIISNFAVGQSRQNLPEPVQTNFGVAANMYQIAGVQVFIGDTTTIRCILSLYVNDSATANVGYMQSDITLTDEQKQSFLQIFTPILQATLQQGGTGQSGKGEDSIKISDSSKGIKEEPYSLRTYANIIPWTSNDKDFMTLTAKFKHLNGGVYLTNSGLYLIILTQEEFDKMNK